MKSPSVLALILLVFLSLGCTKADPEAYKSDPILQDYQSQLSATASQLEGLEKEIASTQKDMKSGVPQSGQYGANLQKLNGLLDRKTSLEQQIRFWKIRIESRAKAAQEEYLIAFKNKKPWPDKNMVETYFTEKRLRQAKLKWDQKDRIKAYEKSLKGGEGGAAGAPGESEGGGHE